MEKTAAIARPTRYSLSCGHSSVASTSSTWTPPLPPAKSAPGPSPRTYWKRSNSQATRSDAPNGRPASETPIDEGATSSATTSRANVGQDPFISFLSNKRMERPGSGVDGALRHRMFRVARRASHRTQAVSPGLLRRAVIVSRRREHGPTRRGPSSSGPEIPALGFLVELLACPRRRATGPFALCHCGALLAERASLLGRHVGDRASLAGCGLRLLHVLLRCTHLLRCCHDHSSSGCVVSRRYPCV